MENGIKRTVKSTQEQAVAAWITQINQIRINELIERLNKQNINLEEALKELAELKDFISFPEHILGSNKSKHGEIAEHIQVNFSNARRLIEGLKSEYTFDGVGRTAPEDYLKNGLEIQSKFYNGLINTLNGNHGIKCHITTYPNFVNNGGSYEIPKDQYDEMIRILSLRDQRPSALTKSDWNILRAVDSFEKETGLNVRTDIKPAVVGYRDVQLGTAHNTISSEEESIRNRDSELRKEVFDDTKPSFNQGVKVAIVSSAIEGGVAFCMAVASKRKKGKKLCEFSSDDWKEIGVESGEGILKGAVRGGTVYALTNFTATPANVASAYVTAAFGVAAQVKALEEGRVSPDDFIINCETVCLDVTVSAIASLAGQMIIPIPVLGAIIGNVAGEFVYELCKKYAYKKEQTIIANYKREIEQLNQQLDIQFLNAVIEIKESLRRFADLEKMAFDKNVNVAFTGSVELAMTVGVEKTQVLQSIEDIDTFFMC